MVKDIVYHDTGLIEVKISKSTLIFTQAEWTRAIKRGKSILRNRQAQKREEKRVQIAVDEIMGFPRFS